MERQVGGHALLRIKAGIGEPLEVRQNPRLLRRITTRGGKGAGARLKAVPHFV